MTGSGSGIEFLHSTEGRFSGGRVSEGDGLVGGELKVPEVAAEATIPPQSAA